MKSHAVLGLGVVVPLCLAAAQAAAAPPQGGHYVYVPPGEVAVIVPEETAMPVGFPAARMLARQQAIMQRMMADMDTLLATPMPDPEQMIRSVMDGMPRAAPGTGILVTSISTGSGSCSQTVTYSYPGNGARPVMKVTNTGNACGVLRSSGPVSVTETVPPAQPVTPEHVLPQRVLPQQEQLWTVGYPPRPITSRTPPRS